MLWLEVIVRVLSLFGLIALAFQVCRIKGIQVYKGRATTVAIAIGISVIIHTIAFLFLEKHFGWFSGSKTSPEGILNIATRKNQEKSPNQSQDECCGESEEEHLAFKEHLNDAWIHRDTSEQALQQVLPPPNILVETAATLQSSQILSAPKVELEIDWNATRLAMLDTAKSTGGEVGQALVAEMMLDADQFMEAMTSEDAAAIAVRTEEIWNLVAPDLPEHLITGTNAAIWRKIFEIQAAVERSILANDTVFRDTDHQALSPEFVSPPNRAAK